MKTYLVIGILLVATLLFSQSKQDSASQFGRYQLFAGEHELVGVRGGNPEKVILRIDTATGRVDEWLNGYDKNGNLADVWSQTGQTSNPPQRK